MPLDIYIFIFAEQGNRSSWNVRVVTHNSPEL